jgi:hypothetical protein
LTAGCADADHAVGRLMTVAGVRAVIALACTTTIEDPTRFTRSFLLSANFGLRAVAFPLGSDRLRLGLRRRDVEERFLRNRQSSCFGAPRGPPGFPFGAAPGPSELGHGIRSSLSLARSPWSPTRCRAYRMECRSNTSCGRMISIRKGKSAADHADCCPCWGERWGRSYRFCRRISAETCVRDDLAKGVGE